LAEFAGAGIEDPQSVSIPDFFRYKRLFVAEFVEIITRYTVVWDADLEAHFVDAWVGSDSQTRALLTDIANWIDANLAVDPELQGQEQSASVRVIRLVLRR
jgi:hypothetical protein